MTEGEIQKTARERANDLLRSGRKLFLEEAGYTKSQILGLGDLALVPSEKISELLRKKALEEVAKSRLKRGVRVVLLKKAKRGKKRKKRKAKPPLLPDETKSLDKLRKWASDWIPIDNELKDTISNDKRETVEKWQYDVMLDTYARMLDSKAKLLAETE